jgi:DNA-binding MarR family transcriptional regulator
MRKDLPFGFARPEDSPGFLLWQATMTWQRQIKAALEPYHVVHAQFVIMALTLWLEAHGHESTQVVICRWSHLDKMTVSKSLKKLASMGLVQRSEHAVDTRAKNVSLTTEGKRLVQQLVPVVEGIDAAFFGAVSQRERAGFMKALRCLSS